MKNCGKIVVKEEMELSLTKGDEKSTEGDEKNLKTTVYTSHWMSCVFHKF